MTSPPIYRKLNPADAPILILSVRSDTLPLTIVDEYADNFLAQQISQVSGVAQVSIGGEQRPSIRVQVDPAKLATRGLTLEELQRIDEKMGPGERFVVRRLQGLESLIR